MSFVKSVVAVALSGGVDSAVAAYECLRLGYECIGVTMRLPGGSTRGAEAVARQLGIPLHICDVREEFTHHVIKPFADDYIGGGTPNPCISCNKEIKFGVCAQFGITMGAAHFATGHYARIRQIDGRFYIQKARDENKDQSYYLYGLRQTQLRRVIFPLGGLTKPEVREIARRQGFLNAETPESQDICFIPQGGYAEFIRNLTKSDFLPGNFTDANGSAIGRHKGHIHYTVGQRKGLHIPWRSPLYVLRKDAETNTVVLGGDMDLLSRGLDAVECNWLIPAPTEAFRVRARIRSRQNEQWATVTPTSESTARFVFDEPQRAVARGQHVVAYDGDTVIGGGVIA
jgi:tRNA-specific 2-thiouridylase